MSIRIGAAIAALVLVGGLAQAQDDNKKMEAKPGTAATDAVGDNVPTMKGECAEQAKVDTKAPGTAATEAMGEEVPPMKQASADCPEGMSADTKKKSTQ